MKLNSLKLKTVLFLRLPVPPQTLFNIKIEQKRDSGF
jgi:hypothetical protein